MKFFAALKSAEFAAKVSAAAGFDFEAALKSGDENALKTHISKLVAEAAKPDATLTAQVGALETELEGAAAINATLSGSIEAAGIKLPTHATETTTVQQIAANKAAIDSHIKIRAQGLLAQAGHPAVTDSVQDKTAKTMTRAAFGALSAFDQMEFSKNGGRLTD